MKEYNKPSPFLGTGDNLNPCFTTDFVRNCFVVDVVMEELEFIILILKPKLKLISYNNTHIFLLNNKTIIFKIYISSLFMRFYI